MSSDLLRNVVAKETERLHSLLREYFRVAPKDFSVLYAEMRKSKNSLTPMEYLRSIGYAEEEARSILEQNPCLEKTTAD